MNKQSSVRKLSSFIPVICISLLLVGCGQISGIIASLAKGAHSEAFAPRSLSVGPVPVGLSQSPTLTWSPALDPLHPEREVSHYEASLYRVSDNVLIEDWMPFSSGERFLNVSLSKNTEYYFKLRAVDSDGGKGEVVWSSFWTTRVPKISLSDVTTSKWGVATIDVTLSEPSVDTLSLVYSTSDISAQAGVDYLSVHAHSVSIPAGTTEFKIPVTLLSSFAEGADTSLQVDVSDTSQADLQNNSASVEIKGNDLGPIDAEVYQQISLGDDFTCALNSSGGVKCWGGNAYGQLGDGTTQTRAWPVDVVGLTSGVVSISVARQHACALTMVGGVKCWGVNSRGQLGDGTTTNRLVPVDVTGLTSGVSLLSTGGRHGCAAMSAGGIKCWGDDISGAIGDGGPNLNTTPYLTPVNVSSITTGVTAIAAGSSHTCAIVSGGLRCWGTNTDGRLGDGSTTIRTAPVNVSGLSSGVVEVVVGFSHTCALLSTGEARCWGDNTAGQIGDGTTTRRLTPRSVSSLGTDVVSLAQVSGNHSCAIVSSGEVKCWGHSASRHADPESDQNILLPKSINGLSSGVLMVAGGWYHSCALLSTGGIKCWGQNTTGRLGDGVISGIKSYPTDFYGLQSGVHSVSITSMRGCFTTVEGKVQCWGDNQHGALGDGTVSMFNTDMTPVDPIGLNAGISSLSTGWHSCVVHAGAAKCWGSGFYGQIGDGQNVSQYVPTDVVGLSTGVEEVAVGYNYSCAVVSGGVKCWGRNNTNQLGDGSATNSPTPVDVVGLNEGVKSIALGENHSCALLDSGGVKCWGDNTHGQLGAGTTDLSAVPVDVDGLSAGVRAISVGNNFACAHLEAGGVKCWGANTNGQLGNGTNISSSVPVGVLGLHSGIKELSARGEAHACVLLESGGVKCWGKNGYGELGDLTLEDRYSPVDVSGLSAGVVKVQTGRPGSCFITFEGALKCTGDVWIHKGVEPVVSSSMVSVRQRP